MSGSRQEPSNRERLTRELEIAARQESEARKFLNEAEKLRSAGFMTQQEYLQAFQAWSAARLTHERKMHALSAHLQTLSSSSATQTAGS